MLDYGYEEFNMGRILAWQCNETGKLFVDEKEYRRHLRSRAAKRMHLRKIAKERMDFEEFIAPLHSQNSIAAIQEWFLENSERIMRHAAIEKHRFWNDGKDPDKVVGKFGLSRFSLSDLRWSETTSNCHHAPKGKKTNWGGYDLSIPRGYPGWHGHVSFSLVEDFSFATDFFAKFGIHTGTGGGGRFIYNYECFLFAEEWPILFVTEKLSDRLKEGAVLR